MNRAYLVQTLELLKPALAANDTIPIFQCFCFESGNVSAYNDTIGIVGPSEFEGNAGIHGNTLLGLLSASSAEEVELELGDKDVTLTMGKAVSTLPFNPAENYIFKEPSFSEDDERLPLTQSFMEALSMCLDTVSNDETQPKLHGITLSKNKMFSCNGDTVTQVGIKAGSKAEVFLPTPFCAALAKLWSSLTLTKGELVISDKWLYAKFEEWSLYGQLLEITDPIDFGSLIKRTVKHKIDLLAVPDGLSEALSRAKVLADPESQRTEVVLSKGKMTLFTSTHMGDVEDILPFKGHPDVRANVNASHLQRALEHCDQMAVHENCVVFEKAPNIMLLVSNME